MKPLRFPTALTPPVLRRLGLADVVILCLVAGAIATVVAFAREFEAPFLQAVRIDLRPAALPRYTLYSLMRGVLALLISYLFALGFGWAAARSRAGRRGGPSGSSRCRGPRRGSSGTGCCRWQAAGSS